MLNRMLMTTVAVLALAAPVAAQDKATPEDATQQMGQQAEQAQQKLEEGAAQTGQAAQQDQAAEPEAAQGEAEQPPATAEGQPGGEEPPAMAEEPAEEQAPQMAEEPAEAPPPAVAGDEAAEPAEQQAAEEATPPPEMKFIEVQDEAQFLANDEVIGKDVVNPNDEELGTIADLVMNEEQKLVGVVLSVGGFLGIGDKWVAVPVEQIDFPADEQPARLQIAVTKEQLQNAPDFVTKETAQAQQEADQAQQQMQQGTTPAPTTAQ